MKVSLPIFIEEVPEGNDVRYRVRPLFQTEPFAVDEVVSRAVTKLADKLRRELDLLGKKPRHDELADRLFCPEIEDIVFREDLEVAKRFVRPQLLVATFESLGGKVAFFPTLPEVWFHVRRGESFTQRAGDALRKYIRKFEKEQRGGEEIEQFIQNLTAKTKRWTSVLELAVNPPLIATPPTKKLFAMLGGEGDMDGGAELETVGRCLDRLYPDELDRVACRAEEFEELQRLLDLDDRRPVLIVGERMVGKTALVHEYVFHNAERWRKRDATRRNVWLVSPQRLISGMSYVGQWEKRLLAIVEEMSKREHVLYIDDLLGMFQAGVSAQSNLNVAHVLKRFVERRDIRVLAEITPEALRVFREKDRTFADLFHIVPVRETSDTDTLRILVGGMRQLEARHHCRFDFEALPTVIDVQRRFVRDAAFPGKAMTFLQRVAVKHKHGAITRDAVREEFHVQTGVSLAVLDDRAVLRRKEVIDTLARDVVGQPAAVEAAADVVAALKSRLNDPARPLATWLFLGPTGVGKTHMAKAFAKYLFGGEDKLLRFDMNEFASSYNVARLVGTFNQPEGLLTSAVRRQPYCVILLDEIEKAHRDAFDLLLQVLGEGRLTDALGRTADFTNAVIILTSNLGVKEASGGAGFRGEKEHFGSAYKRAAQKFFRPELYNRFDRVIAFERLRLDEAREIARHLVRDVLNRDGVARRRCILSIDEAALERIVAEGYDATLGARALRRTVERRLTHPIAARLAVMPPNVPVTVGVTAAGDGIDVSVDRLKPCANANVPNHASEKETLDRLSTFLERIAADLDAQRPAGGIEAGAVTDEQYRYFMTQELVRRVERMHERATNWQARLARARKPEEKTPPTTKRRLIIPADAGFRGDAAECWRRIAEADDIESLWRALEQQGTLYGSFFRDYLGDVVREAKLLELVARAATAEVKKIALRIAPLDGHAEPVVGHLADALSEVLTNEVGINVEALSSPAIDASQARVFTITGAWAEAYIAGEVGIHLVMSPGDADRLIVMTTAPVADGDSDTDILHRLAAANSRAVAGGVVRLYARKRGAFDLRSGFLTPRHPETPELRTFLLDALPLPPEL